MAVGVNLGSGQRPFHTSGEWQWINVDVQARWNPDIVACGSDLSKHIAAGSVDMVVMHHVLEHFGCGEWDETLREVYRVLRPDGELLVFVPDMRELAIAWLNEKLSDQIYFTNVYGAYMGDEADRHKWGFSRRSLVTAIMRCAPWRKVKLFDWRKIEGADIAGPDFWILGVEFVK